MKDVVPTGAKWLQERVVGFDPELNKIELASGKPLHYDILVVAAGIQINWDKIKGLTEAMGKNGVCSNYR